MVHANLTARSVGFEDTKLIPLNKIVEYTMSGEVIVVPKCLQAIGYFDLLKEASLKGIRQATSEEKAAQVRNKGFEAFHEVIDLDELPSVSDFTYKIVSSLAPNLAKELVKKVFQQQKAFFFEKYPNVRFHVPYDVVVQRKTEFSKFYWNGKVTAHGPHHDSWYQCPTNCINVWIAIGSVKIGNGLNIYPQVYGKRLPCTRDGKILRNQYFGPALSFELEPGDALIFHGEHLHSSEINCTDSTRYVISMRMTLEKPKFLEESPYKNDYIYSESNDGLKAIFTQHLVKLTRHLREQINLAIGKQQSQNYILSPEHISAFDDTSNAFPKTIPIKTVEENSQNETQFLFDSSELAMGSIRPLSQNLCAARIDKHKVAVFSRYCPHEGADLASGYLRDGCVICPWHNLPISLESGASPCQSLAKLTVFKYVAENDKFNCVARSDNEQ